ncbi:acyl-Coenzyme A oxidase, partial [Characodon lateralis]|nr:acyl-Coenzyme A oxidase [Characodon lateralis]
MLISDRVTTGAQTVSQRSDLKVLIRRRLGGGGGLRHLEDVGSVAGPRPRGVLNGEDVRAIWVLILRAPFMLSEFSKAKSGLSGEMGEFCAVGVWGEGGLPGCRSGFGGMGDPNKRFGASLGALSGGRIYITRMALINLKLAITVAIRFSATRKQFGPNDREEIPVLEYQLQQWRLIPYLAAAYALEHFTKTIFMNFVEFKIGQLMRDNNERQAEMGREIHAIGCSSKPLGSWTAQRGIQECREACGGHGYLAMNRLGDLRDDNDPNCTYEGDNNVLVQQTSNYLLSLFHAKLHSGVQIRSPFHTVDFLDNHLKILESRFTAVTIEDCMEPEVPLAAYMWLICFLLEESQKRLEQQRALGKDEFEARNNSQVIKQRFTHTVPHPWVSRSPYVARGWDVLRTTWYHTIIKCRLL